MATLFFRVGADYTEVIKLQQEIAKLEHVIKNAKLDTPIDELCKKLAAARAEMESMVKSAAIAGQNLTSLAQHINTAKTSMGNATGVSRNFNVSMGAVSSSAKEADGEFRKLNMSMKDFVKGFTMGEVAVKGFHMAIKAIKDAVGMVQSFEAANMTLQAITGETSEGLEELRNKALELGGSTVFTASQVTELETALAKLGFRKDEILDMSEGILYFAQSTGSSLDDAAMTAGAALRMFQAESDETTKYVSAMSAATRMSALDFRAISDNLATFGPMASTMGMGIEDVLALFGKLRDQGIEASTAMTSLRNIFTKVSQGKIEGMGKVSSLDDFINQLKSVQDALGGDTGKAMKMIGPRGGTQFMSLLTAFDKKEMDETTGQMVDSITNLRNRIRAEMEDTSGLNGMADTMTNNISGAISMMGSAWEGFVHAVGDSSAGTMKDSIDGVSSLFTNLAATINGTETNWSDTASKFASAFSSLPIVIQATVAGWVAYQAAVGGALIKEKALSLIQSYRLGDLYAMNAALAQANFYEGESMAVMAEKATATGALTGKEAEELAIRLNKSIIEGKLTEQEAAQIMQTQIQIGMLKKKIAMEIADVDAEIALIEAEVEAHRTQKILLTDEQLRQLSLRKTSLETQKATLAQRQNRIANIENAGSIGKLQKALNALGLSFLSNPYFLIAAAIIGLGVALVNLATHTKAAEQAEKDFEDVINSQVEQLKKLDDTIGNHINVIKDETKSMTERYQAYLDMKELLGDMNGMSFQDVVNMNDSDFNDLKNKAYEKEMIKGQENLRNVFNELALTGDYSISHDQLNKVLDKWGITAKEQREELHNQLDEISKFENDADYYREMAKIFDKKIKDTIKMQEDAAKETAKLAAATLKKSDNYSSIVKSFEGATDNESTLALSKEKIEEARVNIIKLRAELEKAEGDKKITIQAQLDEEEETKRIWEQMQKYAEEGKQEVVLEIKAATEFNETDISAKSADVAKKAYDAVDEYREAIQSMQGLMVTNGLTYDEAVKATGVDFDKAKDDAVKNVETIDREIEKLNKKLKNKNLKDHERNIIENDINQLKNVKKELEDEINYILGQQEQTITVGVQFMVDTSGFKFNYNPNDDSSVLGLPDFSEIGNRFSTEHGDRNGLAHTPSALELAARKNGTAEAVATEEAEEAAEAEADRKKREKAEKETRQRREKLKSAQIAYDNAMLQQEEAYQKKREEIAKRGMDAELNAMVSGRNKQIAELAKKEREELRSYDEYWKQVVKTRDEAAKKIWDAQEALNSAQNEKYEKRYWEDLNDEQKAEFATSRNMVLGIQPNEENIRFNELLNIQRKYTNERKKNHDKELKDLYDFQKEYGTWNEKMLAITREYDMQIAEAQEGGDYQKARSLEAKRRKEVAELDMQRFKDNLDWESVFDDLDRRSLESLEKLREELKKALDIKNLSVEDAKVITEQLDKVEESMRKKGNVFAQLFGDEDLFKKIGEKRQRQIEAQNARTTAEESRRGAESATATYNTERDALQRMLDAQGIKKSANEITASDLDKLPEEWKSAILVQQKKMDEAQANSIKAEEQAAKDEKSADQKEEVARQKLTDKIEMAISAMDYVCANLQSMEHLNEALGLDGTDFAEKVGQIAEVSASATNAMKSFMSGDFVGAAASAIDAITGIGKLFGATYGNMERMNDEIEKLTDTNKTLISALEDVKEALDKSTVFEAPEEYEKAVKLFSAAQKNASQIMIDESKKWEKGSRSIAYHINNDKNFQKYLNEVSRVLNKPIQNSSDFLRLSADEMKQLRDEDTDLFNNILSKYREKENKHTGAGIDELIDDYINTYAGQLESLDNALYEKITGISFDEMFNQFKQTLSDMNSTADDFAKNIEKTLNDIAINGLADSMKEEVSKLYSKMNEEIKDTPTKRLTAERRDYYINEMKKIADFTIEQRKLLAESGIITEDYQEQNFSKGVGQMTQDTAEEMNGRMTMIQTVIEQIRSDNLMKGESVLAIKDSMMEMLVNSNYIASDVASISELMANSYLELQGINDNTANTVNALFTMQESIDEIKNHLKNL